MSAISPLVCPSTAKPAEFGWVARTLSRLADYTEIAKPRISVMVLLTVSCGYLLAIESSPVTFTLLRACVGIAVVAIGSSAINQWIERETDARMHRTMNRPLPSGRLAPSEVLFLGLIAASLGCTYLALTVNAETAFLTGVTFVLYAGVYTPLKRVTPLCTAVGAIPGAFPPVLGWLAAGGQWNASAFSLFAILFLWQFPHFFAIAWLYREEYKQAGLKMLPGGGSKPHVTGLLAIYYALGLILVSLLPFQCGLAGQVYVTTAIVLGIGYLVASILFARNETRSSARWLLWTSLIYLPVILMTLVYDHMRLLNRI
jgi:protoheme IX farnesyltransferase